MNLQEWFEKSGMKYTVFAKRINMNRTTVYFWLKGECVPSYRNYQKIKEVTNGDVTYEEILHEFNKTQVQRKTSKS